MQARKVPEHKGFASLRIKTIFIPSVLSTSFLQRHSLFPWTHRHPRRNMAENTNSPTGIFAVSSSGVRIFKASISACFSDLQRKQISFLLRARNIKAQSSRKYWGMSDKTQHIQTWQFLRCPQEKLLRRESQALAEPVNYLQPHFLASPKSNHAAENLN